MATSRPSLGTQENPTAVVGPYGQQTTLTVDNNGYLSSVIDPANQTMAPTHQANGLLTQLIDARSNVHTFAYDASGFLQQDTEPGGRSRRSTAMGHWPRAT